MKSNFKKSNLVAEKYWAKLIEFIQILEFSLLKNAKDYKKHGVLKNIGCVYMMVKKSLIDCVEKVNLSFKIILCN